MEIIDKILVNNGMDGSEYNPSIFFALKIESINKRDLFQNYEKFKKYQSEIKEKASYFTEITINLIFKVFNIDKNDLDNKYNFINKTAIGYRISLKSPIQVNVYLNLILDLFIIQKFWCVACIAIFFYIF